MSEKKTKNISWIFAVLAFVLCIALIYSFNRTFYFKQQADSFENSYSTCQTDLTAAETFEDRYFSCQEDLTDLERYEGLYSTCKKDLEDTEGLYYSCKADLDESEDFEDAFSKCSANFLKINDQDLYVKIISVFNSNQDAEKISDSLYSGSLQYLYFDYEILSSERAVPLGQDLEINIYKPDGELMQGTSSPEGATMIKRITRSDDGIGWGNSSGGAYQSGLHVIQFVYEGEVVGTEAVFIH